MTAFTHALRHKPVRRAATVGLVAVGALFLSACGDNGDDMSGMDHGSGHSSATATASATAEAGSTDFNDTDVTFAQMMIPHHQQALEMARLADGRASDSEVKDIAAKIEQAQEPEITTMQGWLKDWNKPTAAATGSTHGMDHGSGDGMMSGRDMEHLKGMKGAEFDKMFADMMIEHHNGAITMAGAEQRNGENADAVKMAGDIVDGQKAEVEQLQSVLDRL
ncbi:DUF305 domain-containing protein [Streptomyces phaeoluteigriseus]|uniref:DUF305 domain-containing protein n=1 Tax=Streptomyces phaeoluteigriseus TaxID=114686 RepID=A0ABY4ZD61_9ACTN|nr:DUF305 domain-containing protein [Streptomyces phaeoluteigriseus]USQ86837.1 DUF305 domain-containing protein [Streptomyces phaeoluteigriseus]